jgi:hypothetical protein
MRGPRSQLRRSRYSLWGAIVASNNPVHAVNVAQDAVKASRDSSQSFEGYCLTAYIEMKRKRCRMSILGG